MSKVIEVNINGIECSTEESPIIGTTALATCVGFLAYDKRQKKAIAAHFSSTYESTFIDVINKMKEEKFLSDIEYKKIIKIYEMFVAYDLFDYNESIKQLMQKTDEYKIEERNKEDKIEIKVIDGFYPNSTKINKYLTDFYSFLNSIFFVNKKVLSEKDVPVQKISGNEGYTTFYFDAINGQFVTQEVINSDMIEQSTTKKI